MFKRTGFTLAEVLVTLLVIGVVAALTIPTLLGSTNDNQLKTAYKKAFSSLSNAMDLITANETKCNIANGADLAACFKNSMKGTLMEDPNYGGVKNILVTSDGVAYKFAYSSQREATSLADACGFSDGVNENNYDPRDIKCYVVVDLNGLSKDSTNFSYQSDAFFSGYDNPTEGKDQQIIIITNNQLLPLPSRFNNMVDKNLGYEWLGIPEEAGYGS